MGGPDSIGKLRNPFRIPATYGTVILVLTATTAVAAFIPARRPARVDPRITLNESS